MPRLPCISIPTWNSPQCVQHPGPGPWGPEEHGSGISFQHKQRFEVFLVTTEERFKAVDGDSKYHHFCYQFLPVCSCLLEVVRDLQPEATKI
ncbi:unnamed protein product, partial [Gulo gulo]